MAQMTTFMYLWLDICILFLPFAEGFWYIGSASQLHYKAIKAIIKVVPRSNFYIKFLFVDDKGKITLHTAELKQSGTF